MEYRYLSHVAFDSYTLKQRLCLTERLDYYVSVMDNSGISEYTYTVIGMKMRKTGAAYAKSHANKKKYYQGTHDEDSKQSRKAIVAIVIQILQAGFGISVCILLCEFCISSLLNREAKSIVIELENRHERSSQGTQSRAIRKPQIFAEEIRLQSAAAATVTHAAGQDDISQQRLRFSI